MYSLSRGGKLSSKVIYHYDIRNNKTEERRYKASGILETKTVYAYDSYNNKIAERRIDAQGKTIYSIRLKYDSRANVIMKVDSNVMYIGDKQDPIKKEDSDIHIRTFKYDGYDRAGNWLKQTEVLNNKTIRLIKRQFEYY